MRLIFVVLAALVAFPAAAVAKDKDPGERRICKRDTVTGSRTEARKICRTKAEWAMLKAEAGSEVQKAVEENLRAEQASRNPSRIGDNMPASLPR